MVLIVSYNAGDNQNHTGSVWRPPILFLIILRKGSIITCGIALRGVLCGARDNV